MADEFDGCECVWSHEFAMQRLLAFIRQNQNACTDTECIDVSGRPSQSTTAPGESDTFTFTIVLLMLAMFMYVFSPSYWRQYTQNKPGRRDNNGAPPPPPPPPSPPAIN